MRYDPNIHHRRSIRLKHHSYTEIGAYFITICTYRKQCLFGNIKNGKMQLNSLGAIATDCWQQIPNHFSHIQLDVFVITALLTTVRDSRIPSLPCLPSLFCPRWIPKTLYAQSCSRDIMDFRRF